MLTSTWLLIVGGLTLAAALIWSWGVRRILFDTPMIPQVPPQHDLSPVLLMSATEISRLLRAGELTSYQVVSAYVRHIRNVNPYVNAIVFDRCEIALEEAKEADKILARILKGDKSVKDPGWLLGIPCTVKESMQVTGCPNTSGHPHRSHIVSQVDSPVVKRIRDKGAIVLGVTNTSELCMWYESFNNVYGHTRNAYDVRRLVGGSSGGEGCSIGSMFAPFGLGADIGGSIRMPAFFNGVFGHKCSTHLVPNKGQHPGVIGSGNFLMTTGPLCRHAEDILPLLLVMAEGGYLEDVERYPPPPMPPSELINFRCLKRKDILPLIGSSRNISPTASDTSSALAFPLSAAEAAAAKGEFFVTPYSFSRRIAAPVRPANKLRVYVIEDLGLMGHYVSPSQVQVINECAQRLARELHAEVRILNFKDESRCTGEIPHGWKAMRQALHMWSSLMSQPLIENTFSGLMSEFKQLSPFGEFAKWIVGTSEHTIPSIGLLMIEAVEDFFIPAATRQKDRDMAKQLIEDVERELGDDGVIITPTYPNPAPKHHQPLWNPLQFQYTALFNSLQLPTTAVPLWDPMAIGKTAPSPYDARRSHVRPEVMADFHLPRGVQVSAKWGNDILAISVAAELERMFGGYKPPHWANFATTVAKAEAAAAADGTL